MSLRIDDLCESACYRRRTSDAAPARSHLIGLDPFCATLFASGLGPRASLALECGTGSQDTHDDRDTVRSTHKHVIRCFGLKWVAMMLLIPVPWSRRVWELPFLTARCWPAEKSKGQRHNTSVDGVRQMMKPVRRWRPGRHLVLVVDGGFDAVSLELACVKRRVSMVSRLRWDAALYHWPEPPSPGKLGPKPTEGRRQRSLQGWSKRSETPWETVEVEWYRGQIKKLWVFSRTALWYTSRWPLVAVRFVIVCGSEGKLRMEAVDLWLVVLPLAAGMAKAELKLCDVHTSRSLFHPD